MDYSIRLFMEEKDCQLFDDPEEQIIANGSVLVIAEPAWVVFYGESSLPASRTISSRISPTCAEEALPGPR